MGWALVAALALVAWAGISWAGGFERATAKLLAAALLIGVAGYAWQGRPDLPGSPDRTDDKPAPRPSLFTQLRPTFMEGVGPDADVLTAAEGLHLQGADDYAAGMIRAALQRRSHSADLWAGLGDALVQYAGGIVTPAARYALARALTLRPDHPGPAIVIGESMARNGDLAGAARTWRELLAESPSRARWRAPIEARLAALDATAG